MRVRIINGTHLSFLDNNQQKIQVKSLAGTIQKGYAVAG
jgi:hypothetical protein